MAEDDTNAPRPPGKPAARPRGARRQDVTIDLAATPVDTPAAGASPGAAEPVAEAETAAPVSPGIARPADAGAATASRHSADRPLGPGLFGLVAAAIIGGLIALGVGVGFQASGILPAPGKVAVDEALARATAAADAAAGLEARLAGVETRLAALADGEVKSLAGRLSEVEAFGRETRQRVDASGANPPAAGAASALGGTDMLAVVESRLDALGARIARLETGTNDNASATALAELRSRVDGLELSLTTLSDALTALAARPAAAVESERAARAVAVGMIRQAAERGGSFSTDLAMLGGLGANADDLAALEPLAEKGAPSRQALQASFPEIADAILVATAASAPDAGFLERVAAWGRSLVSIRPTAPLAGNAPEAIVSRMQAAVNEGDLAAALSERDALPPEGRNASAAWAAAAGDRIAIDRLVGRLAAAAAAPAAN